MTGFAIASYLSLYQLRVFTTVWEPFFGSGSEKILNSGVSRILPIPDAALGALGYLADAVTGLIGGTRRWRAMPWIVIVFGLAVGPLGAISILLVPSAGNFRQLVHAVPGLRGDLGTDDWPGNG